MADENNFAPIETAPSAVPQPQASSQQPVVPAPQQPNERTQDQFEKLLESNRSLHTQLQGLQQRMTSPAPQPTPQQRTEDIPDFVEIGPDGDRYVNEQKLSQSLKQMREEASQAKRMAQQVTEAAQNAEIDRQNREAYQVYPELNPDAKNHDPNFNNMVRSIILDSMVSPSNYGGRAFSFKQAADFVRSQIPVQPIAVMETNANAAPTAPAPAQADGNELKQQSTANVASQPGARAQVQEEIDIEVLRKRTRYGDDEALAMRLAGVDHVGSKPDRGD